MKEKRAHNIVPYSTSRKSRLSDALSPERVAVDGKSMDEYLTFISDYAKHVNYYNLNNKKAGNWHTFFSQNDVVFLAMLLQTDVRALHKEKNAIYDKCTQQLFTHLKEEHIKEFQVFFTELSELLHTWFLQAIKVQEDAVIYELENAIKNRLYTELEALIVNDKNATCAPEVRETLYDIYQYWRHHAVQNAAHQIVSREDFRISNESDTLVATCNVFLNSIRYIIQQVPKWLHNALEQEQNHTPHIGLLLAFLKLHDHVKEQFNDLTTKHLDYYYRDLLQQEELPKRPDGCIVFFELAKEASYGLLKRGTRLSAGQTETGKKIMYRTLEEEELSKAKIAEIRTLFISNNPIIAPLNSANLVTGIYALQKQITAKNLSNEEPYSFHLFGTDPFSSIDAVQDNVKQPDIGCAIASPIFYMKEGARSVSVAVRFEEESMLKLWNHMKMMTINSDNTEMEMLYRFFSSSFHLKITGKDDWIPIEDYAVDFRKSKASNPIDEIVFLFSFGKEIPEISGFNPEIHQLHYDTDFPVLQMALQSNNTYYPYTLLTDAVVEEININISCEGIKDLQLYDAFGKLESNKPFEPFGPNPLQGESLYIGYEELSKNRLSSLVLDVEWYQLPQEGFENYYKGYPGDIKNDSFTFSVSALSQGEWTPKEEYRQKLPLFREENGQLSDKSTYVIDTDKIYYALEFTNRIAAFSFENAVNGFFRMELEDPPIGFGQKAYLKIMTNNVYENINARNTRRREVFVAPETPYVPKMRSMRMHYSAFQNINFNTSKEDRRDASPFDFFHLQPFGILKVASPGRIKSRHLVPEFNNHGYLYLGIKDVAPNQTLSLYFRITTRTDTTKNVNIKAIEWEYLFGTSWKIMPRENIIKDDTLGFTSSGIIKMYIPDNIDHNHSLFSDTLFWMRIAASNSLDVVRSCSYINTQAVYIEQHLDAADTALGAPLAKGTITSVYDKNKDVKSVFQPFSSFGRRPAETLKDFYNRISERLFHKNRTVTTGDYERLILEEFPEIFQVSCLTSTLFPEEIAPNEIVLMILPDIEADDDTSYRNFNVNTLERVKEYVLKMCPPSVKITVRNPTYEVIRVSCEIKLRDRRRSGEKLKKLWREINVHIAPWLFHKDQETAYQRYILHTKGIENLIAKQPYVEFVTNFSLVQFNRQGDYTFTYRDTAVGTVIAPSKPWSVFVPAESHDIRLINEHTTQPPTPLKIGVMEIEDDFILQPEESPVEVGESVAGHKENNTHRTVLKVRF